MLRVALIGELAAEGDGRPIAPPASRRAWALLGFLALHPGLHARSMVAARFWPDVLDVSARRSMRSALWALRRALGPAAGGVLAGTRDRVGLLPGPGLWIDREAFCALLAQDRLEEAVALCRGDLLAGLDDPWALEAADEHRERLGTVLGALAARAGAAGDHRSAVAWARRAVALDGLSEHHVRLLMRRLTAAGDGAAGLAAFGRLEERLARELGVGPSLATRDVAAQIRAAGSMLHVRMSAVSYSQPPGLP
jgi:DNA-binding SARP family transcriptional activator